jgi:hypothetical protein
MRKIFFLALSATVFLTATALRLSAQQTRSRALFDDGWLFHKGDVKDAQTTEFRDTSWQPVTLPHDWSIQGPWSEKWASATAYLPGGIGWYSKRFTVDARDSAKKIFIYFDGVYKDSRVWINGHLLGERPNGFVSFYYDMTPYIRFGKTNRIAVRVDHSQFADSRWYTGSGIYRDVYLVVTPRLHLGIWGVRAITDSVIPVHARVRVQSTVLNESTRSRQITVTETLVDTAGRTMASASRNIPVTAGGRVTTEMILPVARPSLWSVDHPNLYTLKTSVAAAGGQVDETNTTIGIRAFRFDADRGFFLNGRNLKLKGVCLHDDAGCLGVAVPRDVWIRRLKILKAAGCNAIRLSHNPHAPELYELSDSMGFLLIDEAFDEWELGKHKWIQGWNVGKPGTDGYHEYFKKWADTDLADMILRDRNHASVIMWSIGNEIDYPNDPYSDPVLNQGRNPQIYGSGYMADHPSADNLGRISRHLVSVVKRYDTTRPVTAALAAVAVSDKVGYADALDVVGYNYQEYRYPEDHAAYPRRKIYGSENSKSYGAWKAVLDNDFVAGQFLWTGIDYLGEAGRFPSRGNTAGLIDMAGFKKPAYYFRQSIWTTRPMIYIGTTRIRPAGGRFAAWARGRAERTWNYRPGDTVLVNCYTNCEEAELMENGKSLGRKPMDDSTHVISWLVPFRSGTLSVRGFSGGKEVARDQMKTAGAPRALELSSDVDELIPDGRSVAHVTIRVVDEAGNVVPDGRQEITCKVSGSGKLLGLESGDTRSVESYTSDQRQAMHGRLLAYVQSGKAEGTITVTVTAPGLAPATLTLRAGGPGR